MAHFIIHRVKALPATPEANVLYIVKADADYVAKAYACDNSGHLWPITSGLNDVLTAGYSSSIGINAGGFSGLSFSFSDPAMANIPALGTDSTGNIVSADAVPFRSMQYSAEVNTGVAGGTEIFTADSNFSAFVIKCIYVISLNGIISIGYGWGTNAPDFNDKETQGTQQIPQYNFKTLANGINNQQGDFYIPGGGKMGFNIKYGDVGAVRVIVDGFYIP